MYIILKQTKISEYKTGSWLELKKPRLDTEKQFVIEHRNWSI